MHRLYEIGFQRAGRWLLQGDELVLQLERLVDRQNVLYAFVSGETVKYVGKTTQALQRRMFGYQKPNQDQRTNWRNRLAIVDLLKQGQTVEILALADSGLLRYGAFHLNLAAGLEDSIIKTLNPEWNGGRLSAVAESSTEENSPDTRETVQQLSESGQTAAQSNSVVCRRTEAGSAQLASESIGEASALDSVPYFVLTLHNTYHQTGFFNVPLNCDRYFGPNAAKITIYCGGEKLAVTGQINRTANTNGTPRIMGAVPLRNWFQKRKVMSSLKVSILGPTSIHILDK